MNLPL